MSDHAHSYERGPIRPPNEAGSLLIRISRNCPWNRCLFCPVYKFDKFSRRSLEEIKKDIDVIASHIEEATELLSIVGGEGAERMARGIKNIYNQKPELLSVADWLLNAKGTVFLQDADNLVYNGDTLGEIIIYLKEKIKGITRITTYARAKSLAKRSLEELKFIKATGLTRVHVGLESGSNKVLSFMKKGVTAEEHVEAGRKAKAAGLILSEYVILGLGGEKYWMDHALQTAEILNQIDPDYIRLRTLAVHPFSPLIEAFKDGSFSPLADDQVLREERILLEKLEGISSELYSDHILNLLQEVEGVLPDGKRAMLDKIDAYMSLPEEERELFRLGRRAGVFHRLGDRENLYLRRRAEVLLMQVKEKGLTVDEFISDIITNYL